MLTTAFFAVIVLKRKLKRWQWIALGLLAAGIAMVQLSSSTKEAEPTSTTRSESKVIGFCAALAACFISGFAGIYFEKVLKESDISVSIIFLGNLTIFLDLSRQPIILFVSSNK